MDVRVVQDRVGVEQEVDDHEVLPDEESPYVTATMTGARNASGKKKAQNAKAVEAAKIVEDAATWDQLKRKRIKCRIKCRTVHSQLGFSSILHRSCVIPSKGP